MNKQVAAVIGGVVFLAALFVGTSWYTGQAAHAQINKFVDLTTSQYAGLIHVAERKSSNGIFNSVEDVTYAIDVPWALLLNRSMQIGAAAAPASANGATPIPATTLPKNDAQFTIHYVIAHGPLPGFKSFGRARIETSLLFDAATSRQIKEFLGTDKPLAIVTTLGWLGGGTVDVSSPAIQVNRPVSGVSVKWQGMNAHVNFTRNAQQLTFSALAPELTVNSKDSSQDSSQLRLTELRVNGHLQRKLENLYTGDESFSVASMSYSQPTPASQSAPAEPMTLTQLLYTIKLTLDGDFYNVDAQIGAGTFAAKTTSLKDIHYDFSINHLHAPTLSALYQHMQDLNKARLATPPSNNTVAAASATMTSMITDALKLLPYSPEFVVQNVGFATSDGNLKLTARVKLDGITAVDIAPPINSGALSKKLNLTADFSIATKLAANFPIASLSDALQQQLTSMEQRGYVTRSADRLTMHVEFKQGAVTINGKPFGAN